MIKTFTNNQIFERVQMTYETEQFVQNVGRIYIIGSNIGNHSGLDKPYFKLIKNDGKEISILIPQQNYNTLSNDSIIILDGDELNKKSKTLLLDWLKSKSLKALIASDLDRLNLIHIASQWNEMNLDNDVQQINMSGYK
jgi:hypothetical protein